MKSYQVIGLMSGTSLDGLDVVCVEFLERSDKTWGFKILASKTFSYSKELLNKLTQSMTLPAFELFELDKEIGETYAIFVNQFIKDNNFDRNKIAAIASHGQTIFHQPNKGVTVQIGCGETLALRTGLKVINDFRKKDVLIGGQGAPLVPIGDFQLFVNEAESFLNIGGFSNISFKKQDVIHAFDICPGNLPLNYLMNKVGKTYDENGKLARSGKIIVELYNQLNNLSYYEESSPKSLGSEWLELTIYPLLNNYSSIPDLLATLVEHVAFQIVNVLKINQLDSVFVTGGGALNGFLIERISMLYDTGKVVIPSNEVISFKEALIFAYLGLLFLEKQANCLSSVTGAKYNVCGGVLHIP